MEPSSPLSLKKRATLCGWLKKQSGLMKQWHRRWFILNDNCLFHFYNEDDRNPQGTIFLYKQRVSVPSPNSSEPDKFLFEIIEPASSSSKGDNPETLILCAASEEERQTWVKALRHVLYADKGGAIFGQSLEETMKYEHKRNRELPYIIEQCVEYLYQNGLETEGIFRMSGRVALVRELMEKFDTGEKVDLLGTVTDVHTVASLLKQYLRDLPDSVIPSRVYQFFMSTALNSQMAKTKEEKMKQVDALTELMPKLPADNYNILKYLCRFLRIVGQHSKQNKMDLKNLGLVFGPNIIRHMDSNPQIFAATTDLTQELMFLLLTHFDTVFSYDPAQRRVHNVPVDDLLRVSVLSPAGILQPTEAPPPQPMQPPQSETSGERMNETLQSLAELDLSGLQDPKPSVGGAIATDWRSATLPTQRHRSREERSGDSVRDAIPRRPAPRLPPTTLGGIGDDGTTSAACRLVPLRPAPIAPKRTSRRHRQQCVRSEDLESLSPQSPSSPTEFPPSNSAAILQGETDGTEDFQVNASAGSSQTNSTATTPDSSTVPAGPLANGGNPSGPEVSDKVQPSVVQIHLQTEALKDELARTKSMYELQVRALKNELVAKTSEHEQEKKAWRKAYEAKVKDLQTKFEAELKSRQEAVERIVLLQSQLERYQMKYGEITWP